MSDSPWPPPEDELSALIAYVRSLRDERPHRPLEVPQ